MRQTSPSYACIGLLFTLAGCAVGPDYHQPQNAVDPEFVSIDSTAYKTDESVIEWWDEFNDKQLSELIELAFAHNHDLRMAEANLTAARAFLNEQQLERYPIVTATGSASQEKFASSGAQTGGQGGGFSSDFYDVGLDASWELDFFGRIRRSVEALFDEYEAADALRRDTLVTVSAEVARNYYELRGAQYQLNVARQNADNQQQTYELTQALLEGGRGTDLDIARAQAQLELTRASIPPLEIEIARAIHRLGVLVGLQPLALYDSLHTTADLPVLPNVINIGDVASLLRRRPDIRVAERQLAATTARIGVSVADLFPRVTLLGSAGYQATSLADLGKSNNERYSFGPTITWAALDLGRVLARIRAAEADSEAQLANYEVTVLTSLEEVENGLISYSKNLQRQEHLRVSAEASMNAAQLARVRYRNGVDNFLNVLDAERTLLEAQDLLAQSATETGVSLILLYKALGGGWQTQEVLKR